MNTEELKILYESNFFQLRKIINYWELIIDSPNNEFDSLNNKVLSLLYNESKKDKIIKVIESELIVKWGFFKTEFDAEKYADEIYEWWETK